MKSIQGFKEVNLRYKEITGATTLTADDSGTTYICTFTANSAVTLPSAVQGMVFSFFVNCTGYNVLMTPQSTERMSLVTGIPVTTAGFYVKNADATDKVIGKYYKFECLKKGYWTCVQTNGTLTAQSS